jgi:hypothetical protein
MGSINTSTKANRLVTGRRYGTLSTTAVDAQEPFTSTIDTNASEVYVQANLIPSSSLPFSGSSQHGYWYTHDGTTGAIDTSVSQPNNAILRYWYRHRLTETTANNQTVWFFIDPPGGLEVGSQRINPQLISDSQVTNFISNKYASGSKAQDIAEDAANPGNPGYNVQVSYLTEAEVGLGYTPSQATELGVQYWAFDYKTGVLQIQDFGDIGEDSQGVAVYVTAYQYVGKTLDTKLRELDATIASLDGTGGGGGSGNYISSSNGNNIVSASNDNILVQGNYTSTRVTIANLSTISASFGVPVVATSFTGSLQGTGSWAVVAVSASITDVTATNATYYPVFAITSGSQALSIDSSTLTYNPSTNVLTTTASLAATASNITNAFINNTPASDGQIVISNGTGQVTGSSFLSFNNNDGGQLIIGGVTIDQNSFASTSDTYNFGFGAGPGKADYISITNANNPNLATIQFNLTASFTGPSTFANSINSTFDDQFILLASGSSQAGGNKDSGIVFEYGNTIGTGSALFFDYDTKRLAFRYSASIADTGMIPQAYVNMTFVQGIADGISNTTDIESKFSAAGGNTSAVHDMKGFMFIDEFGNIYIKS